MRNAMIRTIKSDKKDTNDKMDSFNRPLAKTDKKDK